MLLPLDRAAVDVSREGDVPGDRLAMELQVELKVDRAIHEDEGIEGLAAVATQGIVEEGVDGRGRDGRRDLAISLDHGVELLGCVLLHLGDESRENEVPVDDGWLSAQEASRG